MTQTEHGDYDDSSKASYTQTLSVQASPHAVYDAVTTVRGLRGWWTDNTAADNGGITVRFGKENFQTFKLVELTPHKTVVWEWIAQYFPVDGTAQTDEWVGTRVSFDIHADPDGSSTLVFTHHGLTPHVACYNLCNAGWNRCMVSLTRYLEQGAGTPTPSVAATAPGPRAE